MTITKEQTQHALDWFNKINWNPNVLEVQTIRTVLQERLDKSDHFTSVGNMVATDALSALSDMPSTDVRFHDEEDYQSWVVNYYSVIRTALQRNDVPQGYALVRVDKPITNGMKAEFIDRFSFQTEEVLLDDDGDITGDTYMRDNVVPWDTCKEIYKKMLSFAAAPKEGE